MKLKTLYTSYFSKKFNQQTDKRICISNIPPKWFSFPSIAKLAPDTSLLKLYMSHEINFETYSQMYISKLEYLYTSGQLEGIINSIPEESILMCYEKDSKECHRSVLLQYLKDHYFISEESCEIQ